MGDISAEPSMEEILSSIKRIIAEEGDHMPVRQRRASRAAAIPSSPHDRDDEIDPDEILELSDPMPMVERTARAARPAAAPAQPIPARSIDEIAAADPPPIAPEPPRRAAVTEAPADPIVSRETMAATRAPLEALTRMMVKPEPGNDGTLEGLVRDMLRPMLREWIDANLPGMVEEMVAREIAKITGQQG